MKRLAIIAIAVFLTGCATKPHVAEKVEIGTASRIEFVVKVPPAALLDLPKPPANINVDTATQADVARWIAANEKWFNDVQNRFAEVAKFLRDEQQKLDVVARKENEKQGTSGDASLVVKPEKTKK